MTRSPYECFKFAEVWPSADGSYCVVSFGTCSNDCSWYSGIPVFPTCFGITLTFLGLFGYYMEINDWTAILRVQFIIPAVFRFLPLPSFYWMQCISCFLFREHCETALRISCVDYIVYFCMRSNKLQLAHLLFWSIELFFVEEIASRVRSSIFPSKTALLCFKLTCSIF